MPFLAGKYFFFLWHQMTNEAGGPTQFSASRALQGSPNDVPQMKINNSQLTLDFDNNNNNVAYCHTVYKKSMMAVVVLFNMINNCCVTIHQKNWRWKRKSLGAQLSANWICYCRGAPTDDSIALRSKRETLLPPPLRHCSPRNGCCLTMTEGKASTFWHFW